MINNQDIRHEAPVPPTRYWGDKFILDQKSLYVFDWTEDLVVGCVHPTYKHVRLLQASKARLYQRWVWADEYEDQKAKLASASARQYHMTKDSLGQLRRVKEETMRLEEEKKRLEADNKYLREKLTKLLSQSSVGPSAS